MVDFLEKGGEVDCVVPDEDDQTDVSEPKPDHRELKELRATFKEIRHLEIQLKQLEDGRVVAAGGK